MYCSIAFFLGLHRKFQFINCSTVKVEKQTTTEQTVQIDEVECNGKSVLKQFKMAMHS